jgi:hypothetical protein
MIGFCYEIAEKRRVFDGFWRYLIVAGGDGKVGG